MKPVKANPRHHFNIITKIFLNYKPDLIFYGNNCIYCSALQNILFTYLSLSRLIPFSSIPINHDINFIYYSLLHFLLNICKELYLTYLFLEVKKLYVSFSLWWLTNNPLFVRILIADGRLIINSSHIDVDDSSYYPRCLCSRIKDSYILNIWLSQGISWWEYKIIYFVKFE